MTLQGGVKKFGDLWYDPTQMENIFGLSHIFYKHCTTYNNWKEDALLIHSYNLIVKLKNT